MTTGPACVGQEPRAFFANPATIIVAAMVTAMTFSASGAAPTPLYHLYQERFGLTPALVTVIFASYVLSILLALLTTGALSDHIGRRPTVLGALMLNIITMVMFGTAGSGVDSARAVQVSQLASRPQVSAQRSSIWTGGAGLFSIALPSLQD